MLAVAVAAETQVVAAVRADFARVLAFLLPPELIIPSPLAVAEVLERELEQREVIAFFHQSLLPAVVAAHQDIQRLRTTVLLD